MQQLIDLRDLVSGLATGKDDAVLWMKGIAKAPDNAAVYLPPLSYQFKTPCVISKRKGVRLVSHCLPFPDGDVGCPCIRWAGSTGERVFFFDRCFGCELDGLSVEIDASGTAYTAVDWDDDGPGMSSRNALRRFRVHALHDNGNYVMLRIAEHATDNHEYYQFEDVQLSGGGGANGPNDGLSKGIGIKIGSSQSKRHTLSQIKLVNLGIGIWQRNGSFGATDVTCTNNEIDVKRDNATEGMRLHINSEHSRQALVDTAGHPCKIMAASRFGPQWAPVGKGYFETGELFSMEDASIDDHVPNGATLFDFARHARRVTLIGNRFAPNTPRSETGIDTMPLDRSIVAINNDNVIGLPDVYIRGGRSRIERGWSGDDTVNLLELAGHALEGRPTFVGVSTEFDAAPNVTATFKPTNG